jgi:hypothetical protein
MAKLIGTVRRSDMAGGHWTLETSDGEVYQLTGKLDGLAAGQRVEVAGKVARDQLGIGMTGPHFAVTAIRQLGG